MSPKMTEQGISKLHSCKKAIIRPTKPVKINIFGLLKLNLETSDNEERVKKKEAAKFQ